MVKQFQCVAKPVIVPSHCQCIDPSNVVCLAGRHQVSLPLAELMDGCACRCHFLRPGVEISHSQWQPIINVRGARAARSNLSEVK
jgi:hypothetical protein